MKVTFELKYVILFFLNYIVDIKVTATNSGELFNNGSQKVSNTQNGFTLQWPKGIVTYYLDNLVYDNYIGQSLRMAMNVLESASCMRFRPSIIKPDSNFSSSWIHFTNPQQERNCVHEPEFQDDGEIVVVLGFDCLKEREILHTLLHAIGFEDEVTHPHRDQYIRVMWNNIQPEYRHLYRIRSIDQVTSKQLVEYDPLSIMHFHDRAYSVNGHATVIPVMPGLLISPTDGLSHLDKMRLRLLFGHECNKRKVGDMMDTCKMLLSNKVTPNEMSNVTDLISEENQSKSGEAGKSYEAEEVDTIDKVGDQNQSALNSHETQNDLSKNNSEVELEKKMQIKVLFSTKNKKDLDSESDFENNHEDPSDDNVSVD